MPKYQSSGKYRSKQRYNRSLKDVYRTLQNLYKRIDQLQRYRSSGSSSFGYGHRPRMMSRYQSEPERKEYAREKPEPRYIVKSETPTYKIETPKQFNSEQLVEETESRLEAKLKPLIEGIERKLDSSTPAETESSAQLDNVPAEKPRKSLDEISWHALELREFAGRDWDGTHEDLEFLWLMRNAAEVAIRNREDEFEPDIELHAIPDQQAEPNAFHGTELSTEANLSPQSESRVDEMDFFALESELFGIDSEIEAEVEDQAEVGFG